MMRLSVMYPKRQESQFDHDYYANRYVPDLQAKLKPFGLVQIDIDRPSTDPLGLASPFACVGHFYFRSSTGMEHAVQVHGADIRSKTATFTNVTPEIQVSEVVRYSHDSSPVEKVCRFSLEMARSKVFDPIETRIKWLFGFQTTDSYIVSFLAVLIVASALLAVGKGPWVLLGCGVVATYRALDIITHHLHSMFVVTEARPFPVRTLLIAIINLIQLTLCFGIGFYIMEALVCDSFHVQKGQFRIGDALFLSFVTITTLGAGDMFPQSLGARLLTSAEVFVGLLLIVFIIGRHMASYAAWQQDRSLGDQ